MKNFIGLTCVGVFFILNLCWYGAWCRPAPFSSTNNVTCQVQTDVQSSVTLLDSFYNTANILVTVCENLLADMRHSLPILNSGQFSFPITQLILNPIGCETYQLTERMQLYSTMLVRFTKALDEMVKDLQSDSSIQISSSLDRLVINQLKLMGHFQSSCIPTEPRPGLNELQEATNSFLTGKYPHLTLTDENKKQICRYNFVEALVKAVKTIHDEYKTAIPSNV